jgi:hypothetical protein
MEHRQLVVPRGRRDPSSHPANEEDDQRGKVPQVADTQRIATSHAITKYADDKASRSQLEVQIAPTTTRHADPAVRKPPGLVAQATTTRMMTNDREATMTGMLTDGVKEAMMTGPRGPNGAELGQGGRTWRPSERWSPRQPHLIIAVPGGRSTVAATGSGCGSSGSGHLSAVARPARAAPTGLPRGHVRLTRKEKEATLLSSSSQAARVIGSRLRRWRDWSPQRQGRRRSGWRSAAEDGSTAWGSVDPDQEMADLATGGGGP